MNKTNFNMLAIKVTKHRKRKIEENVMEQIILNQTN
jgi:hypothetical protein